MIDLWFVLQYTPDAMKLLDRVAIVTGAAQGIGAAIAEQFMKEGASVYGLDRAQHIVETERRLQQGEADSGRSAWM